MFQLKQTTKPLYTIVKIVLQLSDMCYAKQLCTVPEEDAYAVMKVISFVCIPCLFYRMCILYCSACHGNISLNIRTLLQLVTTMDELP